MARASSPRDDAGADPSLASICLLISGRARPIALGRRRVGADMPHALPSGEPDGASSGGTSSASSRRRLTTEALRWTYVLRTRERWLGQRGASQAHEADARRTLLEFGLQERHLQAIAAAQRVVVRIPFRSEARDWAARIFPWEYVITAATRPWRQAAAHPLTVMRELQGLPATPWTAPRPITQRPSRRAMFVQSAPGALAGPWNFALQQRRIQRALHGYEYQVLHNPTLQHLRERVETFRPDLVHLCGFDNMQGLRKLREIAPLATPIDGIDFDAPDGPGRTTTATLGELLADERGVRDGLLLSSANGRPRVTSAQELADALSAGGRHCAYFMAVSVENSAARTAALLVAQRAAMAAVGFQDTIDAPWAEYFFELLYSTLAQPPWNLPRAFEQAWLHAREEPDATRATGVTLWAGAPILPTEAGQGTAHPPQRTQADRDPPRLIALPFEELNYAVLHNGGPIFREFVVERGLARPGDWLTVDVELHLGSEVARFSRRFQADKPRYDLRRDIHLPLTARLVRSSHEAIHSSLVVQLRHNERALARDSHRLRLLPVDQWRDNDTDGQWLPSFVLPRDPAVMRAVSQAQRHVRVLRDQPAAGFDGYQAAPDAQENQLRDIDRQVQAVWAALLHDWQLAYINPPPGYSLPLDSQRLRTPSMVVSARAGTCIDLALLFAACLELIDIYPVIFLLHGHALPGYWRHNSFQDDYAALRRDDGDGPLDGDASRNSSSATQSHAWQARGKAAHQEVVQLIRSRRLVPVETVRLTEHCGFVEAIESGVQALSERRDFHSMLDIATARARNITPLPIAAEPGGLTAELCGGPTA